LSTDYVFDDFLNEAPLNAYGRQKLELEQRACALDALVVRLSKVYSLEKGDGTLFDEMAAKLTVGEMVFAAHDQVFAPVFIGDVIGQIISLLHAGVRGIVNVVGPGFASRFEMARTLAEKLMINRELVRAISLDELKDGVQRPKFLKLCSNYPALSWIEGVEHVVKAYA
jgi:dTDP-4-dehydrorhamnose reductase